MKTINYKVTLLPLNKYPISEIFSLNILKFIGTRDTFKNKITSREIKLKPFAFTLQNLYICASFQKSIEDEISEIN